jgi:hypothetical protein
MTAVRRPGTASVVTLFALAVGLIVVNAVAPEWAASVGADVWNAPAARADHNWVVAETEAVNAHLEACAERRQRANQCTAGLAAGTVDIGTAADELKRLLGPMPGYRALMDTLYGPQPTERHLYARHAIDRAARNEPDCARRAALVARLEGEFAVMTCAP